MLMNRIARYLKSRFYRASAAVSVAGDLDARLDYLEYELSRMASLLRHLGATKPDQMPNVGQTKSSFDFQWEQLPKGRYNLDDARFREEAPGYVLKFTGLPRSWFFEKKVIDVGCGSGRYSWALGTLGAEVLSVDQSPNGLERTKRACADFPSHRVTQLDLLSMPPIDETFDLVWCYGVLHHTGDTYGAFRKLVPLVKPGGYLFLMIYGAPRKGHPDDYRAIAEYEFWRRKTQNMTFDQRLQAIKQGMRDGAFRVTGDEYVEGYFDAISPAINDLYHWEEIESWLMSSGFENISRNPHERNHHVVARKRNS